MGEASYGTAYTEEGYADGFNCGRHFPERMPYQERNVERTYEERANVRDGGGYSGNESYRYHDEYVQNSDYPSTYDDNSEVHMRDRERDRERSRRRPRERRRDRRHDRDRDRDRDGDRDRDRDRIRDPERVRDRGRVRSRERSRDRDRSPGRFEDSYNYDNHSSDDDNQSYRERDSREERGGEKWMTDTPTNTILLRGLPPSINEKDIRAELMMFGAPVKDVRLMRRSTGASRGFAFVEFQNVADSQRWMDQNQGRLNLMNQHSVGMHYSTPRAGPEKSVQHKSDWTCSKCGVHNFKRRDYCFKCNISREESERTKDGDGFDQVGTNPCNTLILRGLDALTTEESLLQGLRSVTSLTVKNIRIIRDDLTNTSRGYGFVEMNSITESTQLLEQLTDPNTLLEVDGKQILVSYAKNTFSTVMATLSSYGTSQQTYDYSQQQQQGDVYQSFYQTGEYPHGYDASTYYEQNGQYYNGNYDYSQYYNGQYAHSTTPGSASQTQIDSTNAAAAVAQAAIAQAHAAKQYQKQLIEHKKISKMSAEERLAHQAQEWTHNTEESSSATTETAAVATTAVSSAAVAVTTATTTTTSEYATYPPPDVSTYQFDESSGYYFDPMTGLYYDANSQYYYNAQTGQFMYWDAEKSTYLPAPSGSEETSDAPNSDKTKKDKEKKEKVKIAKKIAKDMEKWAKTLNAQKEMMKEGTKKIIIPNSIRKEERESATADAGFAILEKVKSAASFEDKKLMPPPVLQIGSTKPSAAASSVPGLVASYGGDSDSEDEDSQSGSQGGKVDESKLVDWSKLACLLCKRQFQSKEILAKHTQFSDLHKQNIEALQGSKRSAAERKEYRDRAKERRQKYGTPAPPEPKKRFEAPLAYEEPTKAGIGQDNIGSKLLQKMGWSAGMGLGKANQGIVKPIETKRRVQNAGLGVRGANVVPGAGDTYKEAVKKTMFARYHDTE